MAGFLLKCSESFQEMDHSVPLAPESFEDILISNSFLEDYPDTYDGPSTSQQNAGQQSDELSYWVFAYGSLCWHPGIPYRKCITGYIKGYARRFWQGTVAHRGTPEKPGRVATLIEEKEAITWGCAYLISGDDASEYLKNRECKLGGYVTLETKFYPRVASLDASFSGEAIPVLLYIATPENDLWLGDDHPHNIAQQIAECKGPSGFNAEYLLRLAEFMHDEIPDVHDDHLFELENLVLQYLHEKQIPVQSVMGSMPERIRRDSHENIRQPPTFEFTSRLPARRLRCLNI